MKLEDEPKAIVIDEPDNRSMELALIAAVAQRSSCGVKIVASESELAKVETKVKPMFLEPLPQIDYVPHFEGARGGKRGKGNYNQKKRRNKIAKKSRSKNR